MPKRDEHYLHKHSFGGDDSSDLERPRPVSSRNQDKTLQSRQLTSASPIICLYFQNISCSCSGKMWRVFFFPKVSSEAKPVVFLRPWVVYFTKLCTSFNRTPAKLPFFFLGKKKMDETANLALCLQRPGKRLLRKTEASVNAFDIFERGTKIWPRVLTLDLL